MRNTKKVLIDTSTLFSGLGWSGPPSRVLLKIHEENFKLTLSDYILDELSRHLQDYPKEKWERNLSRGKELVGDNKDAPIMAAYLLEDVDILITSNEKDFPTQEHENLVTPKQFLEEF